VRVQIESKNARDLWTTMGVSENIIEASYQALVDSIQYRLSEGSTGRRHDEAVANGVSALVT
jgi:2-isopropylmalate synthase